jgi:hypothetical protein
MSEVKFLSKQVSYRVKPDGCSIVISGKTDKWKESLLAVWMLAWTICGVYFVIELFAGHPRETVMALVIMLFFWLYFEIKIGRALLWRLWGFEQLLFRKGNFSIKRSIRGYGKVHNYFTDNIERFSPVELSGRSFLAFMENSFWIVGGERIYFDYLGRKIGLGRQVDDETRTKLMDLLNKQVNKWK